MVYRLTISYRGTAYAGWQRQPMALGVQQCLEEALARVTGEVRALVGAGRTDAGVHARGQVAHVELDLADAARRLVHGVNRYLPDDIRVLDARREEPGFHARKSALAKEYRYRVVREEVLTPLDSWRAVRVRRELDVEALARASTAVVGEHDFSAFALSGGSHSSSVRRIHRAEWVEAGAALEWVVVGDGFLRGMVRSLVGTLLEVGEGRREASSLTRLLAGAPRGEAGPTAPARALVLERVFYPGDAGGLW